MENTITVYVRFHDIEMLKLAGIKTPEIRTIESMPSAVPAVGDIIRFDELNYESGELALFQVSSRAHLFGEAGKHRVQLSISLVVAHQP